MGCRPMIVAGGCALLLAACGGSSQSTSSSTKSGGPLPQVAHRLLTSAEMPAGFRPNGQPSVATSVQAWLRASQTPPARVRAETARLKRLGFVAGASQSLSSAKGAGLSLVEQFREPGGARAEFAAQVTAFKFSAGVKQFPVPGIPVAFGFAVSGNGTNVAFADADYYYVLGAALPPTPANRSAVIGSVRKLYDRVHS